MAKRPQLKPIKFKDEKLDIKIVGFVALRYCRNPWYKDYDYPFARTKNYFVTMDVTPNDDVYILIDVNGDWLITKDGDMLYAVKDEIAGSLLKNCVYLNHIDLGDGDHDYEYGWVCSELEIVLPPCAPKQIKKAISKWGRTFEAK